MPTGIRGAMNTVRNFVVRSTNNIDRVQFRPSRSTTTGARDASTIVNNKYLLQF